MNILYVIHQFFPEACSGTERFLLNLATSVQRSGHRADVVTYSLENRSLFQRRGHLLVREYTYKTLFVTAIRHDRVPLELNTAIYDPKVADLAKQLLAASKYDLVHLAHPMRLAAFASSARELGIPSVVTLTDFWTLCPKITLRTSFDTLCNGPGGGDICRQLCPELSSPFVKSRLQAARDMLQQASVVTSPSHFAAALVQREFPEIPVRILPHGVKLADFNATLVRRDVGTRIVFGYCGGFAPHKGVHLLINAFRSLQARNAELRIYGAAPKPHQDYERTLHRIAGGDSRIRFCGRYSDAEASQVFAELDVLVIPSLSYETYSFTLHEAFASKVPVIASAIGALAEKIVDSVTGLTFPMGDEAQLAERMKRVIDNPSVLAAIRRNIGNLECPVLEEEAWSYEKIYRDVRRGEAAGPKS
jgi:glycosyltransferase involved in cell wall biosynthesis